MKQIIRILMITASVTVMFGNFRSSAEAVNCPTDLEADLVEALKTCADEMQDKDSETLLANLNANKHVLKRSIGERSSRGINISLLKREAHEETRFKRKLLDVGISLLRGPPKEGHPHQEPRDKRSINITHLTRDAHEETRFKRKLLDVGISLLRGPPKEGHPHQESRDKRSIGERFSRGANLSLLKREAHEETRFKRKVLDTDISLLKAPSKGHLVDETSREKREEKKNKEEEEMKKEIGELVVCAVEKLIKKQPVLQKSMEECAKLNDKDDDESQEKYEKCVEDRVKLMCPNLKMN